MIALNTRTPRMPLSIVLAAITTPAIAQVQETRLTPRDPITSDVFGYDVAFDGTTILGGAPFGTHSGFVLPGRAYVFQLENGVWTQQQRLLPSQLQNRAFFGINVTIDGDALAIAAPGEDSPTANAGAAYVFEQVAGVWSEVNRLVPAGLPADAGFGSAIEMQGDTIMIGAWGDTHAGEIAAGAVYVYERTAGVWTHTDTLHADDPAFDDNFGAAISIDGDTAIVGAIDDDHSGVNDPGAVYVFEKSGGTWQQAAKLIASNPTQESLFGGAVALHGDTLVVGAEDIDSAYIFERTNGVWAEALNLTGGGSFGVDVDIDADTIIIGAFLQSSGVTHVYRRVAGQWQFDTRLTVSDPGTLAGWRLALKGDRAAIGGPFYQTNRGAVYVMTGMNPCMPDCDQSTGPGVLDVFDFLCFQDKFVGADPYACDCDLSTGPAVCDVFDFLCFQNAFVAGCQ